MFLAIIPPTSRAHAALIEGTPVYAATGWSRPRSPLPASNPAMAMSSSSAAQCKPRALIRTILRCAGEPCSSRGNQASGTPNVRPSDSSTHKVSRSQWALLALTEIRIPSPLDLFTPPLDDAKQLVQCPGVKAIVGGNVRVGSQPELRFNGTLFHMHMRLLARAAFVGIEEKPKAPIAKDHRRGTAYPLAEVAGNRGFRL